MKERWVSSKFADDIERNLLSFETINEFQTQMSSKTSPSNRSSFRHYITLDLYCYLEIGGDLQTR
jgi:hypothetical protein